MEQISKHPARIINNNVIYYKRIRKQNKNKPHISDGIVQNSKKSIGNHNNR